MMIRELVNLSGRSEAGVAYHHSVENINLPIQVD
jgi:hypothetical protein